MKRLVLLEYNEQWGKGTGHESQLGRNQTTRDLMAVIKIWVTQILSVVGNLWEFRAEEDPAMIYILEGIALVCPVKDRARSGSRESSQKRVCRAPGEKGQRPD